MFGDKTTRNIRKKKEEQQVELRQQKKEELLNKKRSLSFTSSQMSDFISMKNEIYSNDLEKIYKGVKEFRSMVSVEDSPPIQPVIDSGVVPRFVQMLDLSYLTSPQMNRSGKQIMEITKDTPEYDATIELINKIRVESAWVITNIASGTTVQTRSVTDSGAIPYLVNMLFDTNDLVVDQSVWALGNIAGDSEEMRDIILSTGGALKIILSLINKHYQNSSGIKMVRNLAWLLSNLNRGRNPPPKYENMKESLEVLFRLIESKDTEVVADAYWALSYIADVDQGCTDLILGSQVMDKTYNLLQAFENKLNGSSSDQEEARICTYAISPIIRMLGNIVTGTDEQTTFLLRNGFLKFFEPIFYKFENQKLPRLRKEICWALSNITAGTVEQVQAVVDQGLVTLLIDAMSGCELFIRKEACWAISNILFHCTTRLDWLKIMINGRLVDALNNYLEAVTNIPEMQCQVLDCFRYALDGGKKLALKTGDNPIYERMVELDVVDSIEALQSSYERSVSDKAYAIIADYFDGAED